MSCFGYATETETGHFSDLKLWCRISSMGPSSYCSTLNGLLGKSLYYGRRDAEVDFLLESLFFSGSIDILFDQVCKSNEHHE